MAGRAPKTPDDLRDWLRQLKEQSGASYAEIARAIGEEERTVKRWMPDPSKKATVPSGDALLKALDFFGVRMDPPAPREAALSLMGEIRELQHRLDRLEGEPGADGRRSTLSEIDARLEELAASVAEALELLRPHAEPRAPRGGARTRGKAAQ